MIMCFTCVNFDMRKIYICNFHFYAKYVADKQPTPCNEMQWAENESQPFYCLETLYEKKKTHEGTGPAHTTKKDGLNIGLCTPKHSNSCIRG